MVRGFVSPPRFLQDGTSVRGDTGPELGTFLGDGPRHGGSLHFTFVIDNHSSRILKVDKDTFLSTKGLALPDNDSRHYLLSQFRLALFDRAHDHVTRTSFGVAIKTSSNVTNADNMEILGARIIGAVDHGGRGETRRNAVLDARGGGASSLSFCCFTHVTF